VDQGSKWLVVQNMNLHDEIPVIGNFFVITSHRNTGAAFGILEGQRWLFIVITSVVLIGMIYYMRLMIRGNKRLLATALSFLIGGAIGNFIDRLLTGEVVDFLQFNFVFSFFGKAVDYTFAIFNIADAAITVGVILIILDTIISSIQERKSNKHESQPRSESEPKPGTTDES
jgi:signal peptidase II